MICLLIRHAMTDAVGKRITGWLPGVHLTAQGKLDAEQLAERLARAPIRAVYSSPLERARETAGPIAARHGLEAKIRKDIGELHVGEWEGRELSELEQQPLWRDFNSFRSSIRMPGGELMLEVQARMVGAIEQIRAEHPDSMVAVVSHGDPIRATIAHYAGIPLDFLERFEISPASVSTLVLESWGVRILGINQTDLG